MEVGGMVRKSRIKKQKYLKKEMNLLKVTQLSYAGSWNLSVFKKIHISWKRKKVKIIAKKEGKNNENSLTHLKGRRK